MNRLEILRIIENSPVGLQKIYGSDDLISILNSSTSLNLKAYEALLNHQYKVLLVAQVFVDLEAIEVIIDSDIIKLGGYKDIDDTVDIIIKLFEKKERILNKI